MIHRIAQQASRPHFIPKYADADIIKNVINSDYWKHLFMGDGKASWILIKAIVFFKMEMFIAPLRALLRINHGKRTIGFIIWVMSSLMMMAFNTQHLMGYLATFFPLAAPLMPVLFSAQEIYDALFVSIRSEAILCLWVAYLILAPIHMLRTYKGWGTIEGDTVHGTSLIHLLIGKPLKLSQGVSKIILEPVLIGGIGLYLMASNADFTCGLFLMISAACSAFHEARNAVMQYAMS